LEGEALDGAEEGEGEAEGSPHAAESCARLAATPLVSKSSAEPDDMGSPGCRRIVRPFAFHPRNSRLCRDSGAGSAKMEDPEALRIATLNSLKAILSNRCPCAAESYAT
jgi:hypothetical protein